MKTNRPTELNLEGIPFTGPATKVAIWNTFDPSTRKAVAPKGELETLNAIRIKLNNLLKMEEDLSGGASRRAYVEHISKMTTQVANGETANFQGENGWTAEDWAEDFTERRRVVRTHRVSLSAEALPIAKAIRTRWAAAAIDVACDIESSEKALAEKFALPFSRSNVAIAIRNAASEIGDPNQLPLDGTVEAMLPFLTF